LCCPITEVEDIRHRTGGCQIILPEVNIGFSNLESKFISQNNKLDTENGL